MEISNRFKNYLLDWDYTYYLLVGGYGSGKSHHTALKLVLKALEEKRTILVARAVFVTLKDSCFSLFKDILDKLGLLADEGASTKERRGKVIAVSSPMEIRFPNGSRIIFRGLDNFERIKSIHGVSIVWVEECTEIKYDVLTSNIVNFQQCPTDDVSTIKISAVDNYGLQSQDYIQPLLLQ